MARKTRVIVLIAVGLFSWGGAILFPLDAVMVPAWHDSLWVVPKWGFSSEDPVVRGFQVCVSDFEVVSPGVLSFKVEEGAPLGEFDIVAPGVLRRRGAELFQRSLVPSLGGVGKRVVLPADEFILSGNHDLYCSRPGRL